MIEKNQEKFLETIETKISGFEKEMENNLAFSESDYERLERSVNNLAKIASAPEEKMKEYQERLSILKEYAKPDHRFVSKVSPKNMKANHKKMIAAIAITASLTAAISAVAYNNSNYQEEIEIEVETTNKDQMDPEYKQMADQIVAFMNDSISKGLMIDENSKETFAKKFIEYYMLNNMDKLTDEQWGNVFQNSTVTADDIMNSKFELEWIDEQRVTVAKEDMMLDYNLIFEGNDAKLLNDAAKMFNNIKKSKGLEKNNAISIFKEFILENLGTENNRMLYSERAMDTFRAIYFDAFDELTEHKVIDDELEHAINTTITCSLGESDLDVKDKTIKSLQSDFEVYEQEKLQKRLENGWQYVASHEVNSHNDISEFVEYVSNNIDLSLYRELPDYEEEMTKAILTNDGKSNRDSGISDGNGGIIDSNQFIENGIDINDPNAKQKNEEAVKNKTTQKTETKDVDGQIVADPELTKYYTQLGASDYFSGSYNESKVPSEYLNSYRNGKNVAVQSENKVNEILPENTTEFIPVQNGESKYTENTESYDYTNKDIEINNNQNISNTNGSTQFIPVDGDVQITETIENIDYSYLTSSDLDELKAFREELQSIINEEESTFIKTK